MSLSCSIPPSNCSQSPRWMRRCSATPNWKWAWWFRPVKDCWILSKRCGTQFVLARCAGARRPATGRRDARFFAHRGFAHAIATAHPTMEQLARAQCAARNSLGLVLRGPITIDLDQAATLSEVVAAWTSGSTAPEFLLRCRRLGVRAGLDWPSLPSTDWPANYPRTKSPCARSLYGAMVKR